MKRIAFTIVYTIFTLNVLSQNSSHIIDRGETLSSIAKLYNTTEEKIIELNPDADKYFYVGMELYVPQSSYLAQSKSVGNTSEFAMQLRDADKLLDSGESSKAAKAYSNIIKKYKHNDILCVDAYYGRALAYYNQNKWKSAIKDFEKVLSYSKSSDSMHSHSKELLAKARECREEQLQRRNEIWGGIIVGTAVAATTVIAANQQAKSSTSNYNTTTTARASNMDYLLDPNYAIQQVNAQNEAEYQEAKRFNSSLTREQFMQMKAQAYQETRNSITNTGSNSSTKDVGGRTNSTDNTCPSLKQNSKYYCANTGKCGMCNGDGLMDGMFGQGYNALKCTLCGGTGRCKYCNK